ncbi:DNA replication complex GINS protein PSF1 [Trametes pubescens]|uniref:DNA replication complex GINS protein PSF1 n=1 Tax=Trametes pubescens TaxID=154538 RepID=A0A1M2VYB9_TRAPU|nr:DNA replication complex GINS protein PSF1 [Trametes pubescens]
MNTAGQYGDLATQLLTESRRSTATSTLFKYNDVLVRAIVREQRALEARIEATLARSAADPAAIAAAQPAAEHAYMPTVLLYQTAILRNKRCLLAYHHHRLDFLKDLFWSVGGALPLLLSMQPAGVGGGGAAQAHAQQTQQAAQMGGAAAPQDVRSKLSPHEVDFLRSYAASLLTLRTDAFSSAAGAGAGLTEDIDLLAPIAHPPKDLQVHVRVVRDCGVVHTELGAIDFKRGHRFLVRRSDIEHLIVQGYLEES